MRGSLRLRSGQYDRAVYDVESQNRAVIKALAGALEIRDAETHGHSERVVRFSLRLGRELDLGGAQLRSLKFGALLHDIGKMAVPNAILRKPTKLTDEEWVKMRQHPLLGQRMLRGMKFLEGASVVVAQHHEKWDGSGYPFGLRREEINLNARIFAVADAFDAMISDRVYRAGVSFEAAATEINRCAGRHFDPMVVVAFGRITRREWQDMHRGRPLFGQQVAHSYRD